MSTNVYELSECTEAETCLKASPVTTVLISQTAHGRKHAVDLWKNAISACKLNSSFTKLFLPHFLRLSSPIKLENISCG